MSTRFKGIYQKSFKCFSDISDEKDEEMDIGYPTDVRHVSHIGWDSSSSSAPSWLREFKTSNNVLEPNSSWPFTGKFYFSFTINYNYFFRKNNIIMLFLNYIDLKSAMEAFGEVESSKELGKESKKQYLKKKLSSKASKLCDPWSPRFLRSSKVIA
ncbi:unnamed protein product [Brassica rapa]|uniref:CRIB domain-containing protein n=3 Tax=Brassica TaxID=3705 RepID=A0A3P5XXC9_BRACM|nr:unnamed protein product [Brassica napus]CAG7861332.1 unnamed protein product [Brassica rapa]CDY12914.1 BnaA09g13600D [Brassica napus]VDC59692.1 unnamed protein product [Brassica rapa]